MNRKAKVTVVFDPEAFAAMSSHEIAVYIMDHRNTAIVGEEVGIDRHIIKYAEVRDWLNYENPFSN